LSYTNLQSKQYQLTYLFAFRLTTKIPASFSIVLIASWCYGDFMYRYMMVTAIIVAGGKGSRFALSKSKPLESEPPKQFLMLGDTPVLGHSLLTFDKNTYIDRIILVVPKEYLMLCEDMVLQLGLQKPCEVIIGGNNRQESVCNGLLSLEEGCMDGIVLVHDGARPFVDAEDIDALLSETYEHNAATLGLPVTDCLKIANFDMSIQQTLQRDNIFTIQTPQAFKAELLIKAHKKARDIGGSKLWYDDCQLVENLGYSPKIVAGNPRNIKITHAMDMIIARSVLEGEDI